MVKAIFCCFTSHIWHPIDTWQICMMASGGTCHCYTPLQLVNAAFAVSCLQNRGIDSELREKQDDLKQHEADLRRANGMHMIFYWKWVCLVKGAKTHCTVSVPCIQHSIQLCIRKVLR